MIDKEFQRGKVDTTLFIKNTDSNMIIIQIYIDDIIFGATNPSHYKKFEQLMQGEFEMSMVGEPHPGAPYQRVGGWHFHQSSQIRERPTEEVQFRRM